MRAQLSECIALAGLYCQDGNTRFVSEVSNGFSISSSGQWRVMNCPDMEIPCISVLNTETQFHFTMTHHQVRMDLRSVL